MLHLLIFQNRINLYNTKDVNNSLCDIVLIFLLFGCLGRQANIQLSVTDKKFKQKLKITLIVLQRKIDATSITEY